MIKNSKGNIYYGMHFYPGVAEYQEPEGEPYRVFLNENTIRSMDPSFAGRPIFVEHVEEVNGNIDELRGEADGWVIESFYNAADGKHWAKFIVVSERGERAIKNNMRLSNAYLPKSFGSGGLWNGVEYAKEITEGEYDHLAIVRNPRYEESVIMTPEKFKKYNEDKLAELKRLSNSKEKETTKMGKLNFFKRAKVENAIDPELAVVLPKSGKEMTIVQLVEEMDKIQNMHGYANGDHMVKMGENEMSVNDLVKKHMELNDELAAMKAKKEDAKEGDLEVSEKDVDVEEKESMENDDADGDADDKKKENEEADEEKKADAEKKKNAADKAAAKAKADRVRNAHHKEQTEEVTVITFSTDQIALGKSRYGSK